MAELSKRSRMESGGGGGNSATSSTGSLQGRRTLARGLAVQTSFAGADRRDAPKHETRNLNLIPMTPTEPTPHSSAPHPKSSRENENVEGGGPSEQRQQERDISDVGPHSSHRERAEYLMGSAAASYESDGRSTCHLASNSNLRENESGRTTSGRRISSFRQDGSLQHVSIVDPSESSKVMGPSSSVISLGHWNGQRWRQRHLEKEGTSLWNRVFGARERDGEMGGRHTLDQKESYIKAIHPESPFSLTWIVITTLILLYTLFWTPFSVAFYWSLDACQTLPTLRFDVFVDVWFFVDLFLNFFTGVYNTGDAAYEDRLAVVAPRYVTSGHFFFDALTTTPVGLIEYIIMLECDPNEAAGYSAIYGRFTRIVKPLRLFKLMRLVKVIRSKTFLSNVSAIKTEPPPLIILSRLFIKIFAAVHIGACMFWLVKVASNSDMDVEDFLSGQGLDNASVGERYVTSIYFVSAVITTVGFGDVAGSNTWERLYCVVIMFIGSVIFGTLLANISDIAMMLDDSAAERSLMSEMVKWARRKKVPTEILESVASWVSFQVRKTKESDDDQRHLQRLVHAPGLYKSVVDHLHGGLLHCVPYFGALKHELKELLILELWQVMDLYMYCKDTVMISTEEPCDKLYIITEGYAKAVERDGTVIGEIYTGSHVGERCVLGDPDVGLEFGSDEVYVIASENLSCLVIDKATLESVLANYPEELISEVRSLAADALRRFPPRRNDRLVHPDADQRAGSTHLESGQPSGHPRGADREHSGDGMEQITSPRMRMVMKPTRNVAGALDIEDITSPRMSRSGGGGACNRCSQLEGEVKRMASTMAEMTEQLARIENAVNQRSHSATGMDDIPVEIEVDSHGNA